MQPSQNYDECDGYPQRFVTHQLDTTDTAYNSACGSGGGFDASNGNQWVPIGPPVPMSPVPLFQTSVTATQYTGVLPDGVLDETLRSHGTDDGLVDSQGNPVFQNPFLQNPLSFCEGEDADEEPEEYNALLRSVTWSDHRMDPMNTEQADDTATNTQPYPFPEVHNSTTPSFTGRSETAHPLQSSRTWHPVSNATASTNPAKNKMMGAPRSHPKRGLTYPGTQNSNSTGKVMRRYRNSSGPSVKSRDLGSNRHLKDENSVGSRRGTAEAELARVFEGVLSEDSPEAPKTYKKGRAETEIARIRGYRVNTVD